MRFAGRIGTRSRSADRARAEITKANAELKRQIEAVRASEERLRMLVQGTKDYAFILLDAEGGVAAWNDGAERLNLYREEEIVGQPFATFYPPEVVETDRPWQALKAAEKIGTHEEGGTQVRKDGSQFWANTVITAIRDDEGRLCGYSTSFATLPKRSRPKKIVAPHRRRGGSEGGGGTGAFDSRPARANARDAAQHRRRGDRGRCRGCVEFLNPIAQELTGWTDAEARNRPLQEVFQIINEYSASRLRTRRFAR